ncbi:hypothetical protein ACQCNZ_08305 [Proteus mirabilis]|uniref:hypothetical protein n=2 Tax=Bacteria TaxID=2 RepID=UPI00073AF3FA|nr:hypothetical protein [Proteus mirabilis]AVB31807.1 hypothetical protein C3940_17125 [Proteus mirabilis]EKU7613830.1 hypothetical protein [Proteus mirabilis]EKX5074577.1 hypothetical protein [Proteus mirabilis]ELA7738477.1 hypothetical protein [Proteus mirabilis]ELA7798884.1 hypothetical protein [Proteus mirabilis]
MTDIGIKNLCEKYNFPDYPKWDALDAVWWKTFGGSNYLTKYKDGYIIYHKDRIKEISAEYNIPPELLAGVARNEVGGMPDFVKPDVVLKIRWLDYSGNDWIDENLTMTERPERTSIGLIAMQIRIVAETFGKDPRRLSDNEIHYISQCLMKDSFNLPMVAIHLRDLIEFDYPGIDTSNLNDIQLVIAGSRYNRGTTRKLDDFIKSYYAKKGDPIREWTSYGRRILENRDRIRKLLGAI